MGKFLIISGIILILTGIVIQFAPKIPFLGRLPGDIHFERGNFKVYIPLASGLLISLLVSMLLLLVNKIRE